MKKKTLVDFFRDASIAHGTYYNYSKVEYNGCDQKIEIICPIHGSFFQTPNSHLSQKCGCPKCGKEKSTELKKYTTREFIMHAIEIHGEKYDYSKSMYGKDNKENVEIICKKHGVFLRTPNAHLSDKQGCPKCRASKGELKIMKFLEDKGIQYVHQMKFDSLKTPSKYANRRLPFDVGIPSKKMLIEFDGPHHFRVGAKLGKHISTEKDLKRIQLTDQMKTEWTANNGWRLFRIPYTQMNNIEIILENEIV